MDRFRHWFEKFFFNKKGGIVIWQAPNLPLWGWFVFGILARLVKAGSPLGGFHFLSQASLFTWAYLEIRSGASPFRRTLGAAVMVLTIASVF